MSTSHTTDAGIRVGPLARTPADADVLALIRRAENHELGVEFLARGAQDAVAATFGVHAFVVDAARDHLAAHGNGAQ